MTRLLLLRHGSTAATEERRYSGWQDEPLSARGAAALGQKRARCTYPPLDGFRIITSGMLRAEQTLALLYGSLPHERLPAFRELNFGIFEGRTYGQLRDDSAYRAWLCGDNTRNVCPGGESGEQMERRVLSALDALLRGADDVALFTHGGPIAAAMAHLFPGEQRSRYGWQPECGEGYMVSLSAEGEARSYARVPTGAA